MKWHFFPCIKILLLFLLISSCREKNKEQDLAQAVQSTTSIIDQNIRTEVRDGIVTMKGEVQDVTTKTAAINAVKHIEGVKTIESYLTVKAPATVPLRMSEADIRIKQAIDSALVSQQISGIDITVTNGEVILSGQVNRASAVAVLKIAGDAHPSKLTNHLSVTDKEN